MSSNDRPRRRWLRRLMAGAALLLLVVVVATFVGLSQLPGGVGQVSIKRLIPAGEVSYGLPNAFLEQQIASAFPQRFQLTPTLEIILDQPRLRPDEEADFLQMDLELETAGEGAAQMPIRPGTVTLRGQVKFNRDPGTVELTRVRLVSLSGTRPGSQDLLANALLPAIFETMVSPMLEGLEVYQFPEAKNYWQRTGFGLVRDVRVQDGEVAVVVGP